MTGAPTWPALCVYALPDGGSRLIDLTLPVTHKVTAADGTSHWEGVAAASQWGLAGSGSSSTHHLARALGDRSQRWHAPRAGTG